MNRLTSVQLRHMLHRNPEIAYKEFKTTELIINSVKSLSGSDKLKIHKPLETGVLIEYKVNNNPFVLFRADIDALPVKEENEIEFKSVNENMHACGHDVHTSILFSFIEDVVKEKSGQNLLFLFQPAEESGGGAMKFFDTGVFNNFEIKSAFALHVTDEYPFGTIASTAGVLFASALEIDVEFIGISSHVAFPFEGRNAFNALRLFLDVVDKMPNNNYEPFIFGIGKIQSGYVRNIAPGYAKLEGSIRGLSSSKVLDYLETIKHILEEIKSATGVGYKIIKGSHYPEVMVDKSLFNEIQSQLKNKYNFIDCGYKMTGEDFGFFSHKFPSFMFWLGTSEGEKYGLHNPRFLPSDKTIDYGKNIFKSILNSVG
ncbi:MAG TPA: amidohydrolase [Ignavibacteriaceae bacterium]|nr:amidohydrolase [Ignavibacteriaceae bacterium]